jgi:hypothetical protein
MSKKLRLQRKTLLAVGEGDTEVAFLKHIRSMYCSDGLGVSLTIKNANGKGPDNVINHAIKCLSLAAFDKRLCLLDTDLKWPDKTVKIAKKHKVELIGSVPCIEGLLLAMLDKTVPDLSDTCKKTLQQVSKNDMTESNHYEPLFPKPTIQQARVKITELNHLLNLIEDAPH